MTTKIKDGLFISDSDFSQDMDFLSSNKITYVINCAGNEVSNRFERTGIRSSSELFDNKDAIVYNAFYYYLKAKKIYMHVEKALCSNQCCLIHSIDGVNRAVICTTIYLMCKYGWQSSQSLQFLQILKPEIRPCQFYIRQLESFEDRVDALKATFPKTRCTYGDDEQLLLNTYNNIIKARQIMPNMTLLKYNKYSKYQEDDDDNSNGKGRIQWFGPLIRPATPSYISVSEDLTLISVYRRNLHNKKLEEPIKSNIKDQIYVSPITEAKPKPKPSTTTSTTISESKAEPTLRKTSSTSSITKLSMTPISFEETKSQQPLSSPSNITTKTKNVFISDPIPTNVSNTPSSNYSSKYANLYYNNNSNTSNNNSTTISNSTTSSKSPSISSSVSNSINTSINTSTIRNHSSRPSSSAYSCSYNNNNNNNLTSSSSNNNNNNSTTNNTFRFISRPASTTPQSNSNTTTPSPPIRPSSAPPKKTPPPLFIKHSVRRELMDAYSPLPSPLTTPDNNNNNNIIQQPQPVVYKSSSNNNNNNQSGRQIHPPPPKFFNYKSPVQHATLPSNSARTMRETIPVKEYPIAKNVLQEGRRISLPPRLDDETIRPNALTSTLQTTGTSMKLRSNTPQPKHTTIKKDKKAFHTTDTVQAWTSRTRRPTPMKKGHTSTVIRSYVK